MWNALRTGQARALLNSKSGASTIVEASEAVRLSPFDPDVYAVRAATLLRQNDPNLAIEDVRRAVQLRPRDYRLWLELGKTLESAGDTNAALSAMSEARARAPYYSTTHWNFGSLLQKLGRYEEAFAAYREASLIQPALMPDVMDRAWESYKGNCELVERAVGPSSIQAKLLLAHFFIEKNRPAEATAIIKRVDNIPYFEQRLLVEELLERKNFTEAHEVWAKGVGRETSGNAEDLIADGNFDSLELSEAIGFGWIVNEMPAVNVTLDASQSESNRYLRIELAGNPEPQEIVSQLVLVQPLTTYQLKVAARAQNLVSGTPLVISVTDVSKDETKVLAQTFLPLGSTVWKGFKASFRATDDTHAVRIAIKRATCRENPCPIFGNLWLDDFSLRAEN
jgi:tetratricopeptide (TPR) repeat protein